MHKLQPGTSVLRAVGTVALSEADGGKSGTNCMETSEIHFAKLQKRHRMTCGVSQKKQITGVATQAVPRLPESPPPRWSLRAGPEQPRGRVLDFAEDRFWHG